MTRYLSTLMISTINAPVWKELDYSPTDQLVL